jgi:hypothetical protein
LETNCRIGKVKPKGNLVLLPQPDTTTRDIEPNKILRGALNQLGYVIVIGREVETDEIYLASSDADVSNLLMLMEKVKHKILRGDFGGND